MARVFAFRGVRYARPDGTDISALTAPPYDVISAEMRARLLERDARNVVALELPEGSLDPHEPGNRYDTGGARWEDWREQRVLAADSDPAIYVLEQRYKHGDAEVSRRGFVAAVALEPFSAGVILPHERTLPKALSDRLNLTRSTGANLSQVFGLFSDPERVTDELIERAMSATPLSVATDDEGVVSTLWAISDTADQQVLHAFLAPRQVFIADGHHRYTTALAYRDERRAAVGAPADPAALAPYDTVMMALVNMDDPGLIVSPTHRLATGPEDFDADRFWASLREHFDVSELPSGHATDALATSSERPSFIVRTRDGTTRLAILRNDVDLERAMPAGTSPAWRGLDVAVLQELVLSPLLDIHPDRPATLERLAFSKDAHAALRASAEHDVVFLLNATKMAQVAAVALAGETMPQKSTYFYPKLLSGLLFKSLTED